MRISTERDIGDKVTIDQSDAIVGVILAVTVRGTEKMVSYQVSWFHNGCCYNEWIEDWRVSLWEG